MLFRLRFGLYRRFYSFRRQLFSCRFELLLQALDGLSQLFDIRLSFEQILEIF